MGNKVSRCHISSILCNFLWCTYHGYYDWCLWFIIMFSRFILLQIWQYFTQFYGSLIIHWINTTFFLSICHHFVNSTFCLWLIMPAWAFVYMFFSGHMLSITWLLGKEFYYWKPVEKQPNSPSYIFVYFYQQLVGVPVFSQPPQFVTVHLSEYRHPQWEWMPNCGLVLHFPVTYDVDHFFTQLQVICVSSLETLVFKFFTHLSKWPSKD